MGAEQGTMGMVTMGLYIVVMFVVFYFLLIRPQKKRDKEARMMLESLVVGDKVVSIGGIYGKIVQLKEDTIVLETGSQAEKSYIKLSRTAVKEIVKKKETKEENL